MRGACRFECPRITWHGTRTIAHHGLGDGRDDRNAAGWLLNFGCGLHSATTACGQFGPELRDWSSRDDTTR